MYCSNILILREKRRKTNQKRNLTCSFFCIDFFSLTGIYIYLVWSEGTVKYTVEFNKVGSIRRHSEVHFRVSQTGSIGSIWEVQLRVSQTGSIGSIWEVQFRVSQTGSIGSGKYSLAITLSFLLQNWSFRILMFPFFRNLWFVNKISTRVW